ncbi:MAG: hypothetical protein ACJ8CN_02990, partial [Gemmatimonadales bacterium]
VQIGLLRRATVAQRVGLAQSLSSTTMQLARRAISRAHPDASEKEVGLAFVALHYGQELADKLRAYLDAMP